jgi:hypothetical protein
MKFLRLLPFTGIFFLLLSCREEKSPVPEPIPISEGNMVLVCNEGNFRWGNASAGLINLGTGASDMDAYQTFNKESLGDVFQSATLWNGSWHLVMNNSGKIVVVGKADFKKQRTLTGFNSPRYLLPISDTKAYVSDLYGKCLWIVESGQTTPSGKIPMPGWTEEMLLQDGKVYVVCRDAAKVIRVDPATNQILDSILLPGKATSLAKGPAGKIWLGFEDSAATNPGVLLYNPNTNQTEKTWFSDHKSQVPDRLTSSLTGDTLFFLAGGACFLNPGMVVFGRYPIGSGNWYGLGYDAKRRELWISDVKDYLQASRIHQIDVSGNFIKDWKGGILTNRFYFW